jgi:hypothetical protein
MSGERRAKVSVRWADKKSILKDENSTEMFSYQETALTIHPLAQRALVLLALRSYEAKNERRKM